MGEVTGLYEYPFTGGLPNSLESMLVCAAGPDGNRRFVAYDPENGEAVSQRHCNAFYGATAVAAAGSLEIVWRDGSSLVVPAEQDGELVTVSEYDVLTPLIDMGDKVAHSLSTYAGRDLRLPALLRGYRRDLLVNPLRRLNIGGRWRKPVASTAYGRLLGPGTGW